MERVHFSKRDESFTRAEESFREWHHRLLAVFPGADIEHVGSTAIPGTLTKGDLDVQVRVEVVDFAHAEETIAGWLERNRGGFDEADARSFKDDNADPPVGIHLTVRGGTGDFQWRFRDILLSHEPLRKAYDELKGRFEGMDMSRYRDAKHGFFSAIQGTEHYRRHLEDHP